jgi:hypothetical protein
VNLQISSAELIRVLHGASNIVIQACCRSGTAAFNAISGDEILSRCSISFETLSIVVDVMAFFAGDENALEMELWGLWQVCICACLQMRMRHECWVQVEILNQKFPIISLLRLMQLRIICIQYSCCPGRHRPAAHILRAESKRHC